jgi:hypothetical protein
LGRIIDIDESFKVSTYQTMVRILVEFDIGEGLTKSMEIVVGHIFHAQFLEYYKIPFRCV